MDVLVRLVANDDRVREYGGKSWQSSVEVLAHYVLPTILPLSVSDDVLEGLQADMVAGVFGGLRVFGLSVEAV